MVKISVKTDVKQIVKKLNSFARKQAPFATSKALNDTAFQVMTKERDVVGKHIDKPTPFTKRGFRFKKSNKRKLVAEVFIPPAQNKYMKFQVDGGTRSPNRTAIPIPVGQKKNKYGNMPRNKVKTLLAGVKTFSGRPKGHPGAPAGIYKRLGAKGRKKLRLMVKWHPENVTYKSLFPFYSIARREAQARFPSNMRRAMAFALRTAR